MGPGQSKVPGSGWLQDCSHDYGVQPQEEDDSEPGYKTSSGGYYMVICLMGG